MSRRLLLRAADLSQCKSFLPALLRSAVLVRIRRTTLRRQRAKSVRSAQQLNHLPSAQPCSTDRCAHCTRFATQPRSEQRYSCASPFIRHGGSDPDPARDRRRLRNSVRLGFSSQTIPHSRAGLCSDPEWLRGGSMVARPGGGEIFDRSAHVFQRCRVASCGVGGTSRRASAYGCARRASHRRSGSSLYSYLHRSRLTLPSARGTRSTAGHVSSHSGSVSPLLGGPGTRCGSGTERTQTHEHPPQTEPPSSLNATTDTTI